MESKLQNALLFYLFNKKHTLFGGNFYLLNIPCSAQSGKEVSFRLESTQLFPPRQQEQTIMCRTPVKWGSSWGHNKQQWERGAQQRAALTVWCVLACSDCWRKQLLWTKLEKTQGNNPALFNTTNIHWLLLLVAMIKQQVSTRQAIWEHNLSHRLILWVRWAIKKPYPRNT